MAGPSASQPCQTCQTTSEKTFTCIQCNNLAFCDVCWPKWVLHVNGAVGWNGKPHEKADPIVVSRLREILEPTRTEADHESELLEDQDTTWFGFGRDASGHPVLHDYGRFAAIMNETAGDDSLERYPQLASFVGETGAGKSTIIKLLIESFDFGSAQGSRYYSPVTSSNIDRISTTGDVHLYADPSSLKSTSPLLFVDCEGLNGGEGVPKQLRNRALDLGISGQTSRQQKYRSHIPDSPAPIPSHRRYGSTRSIAWAETPQTKKREFTVAQLYPRILYTFSDVVIFVLRNPRSFESTVLSKLIQWGAASIDKSLNQPVLPHAVIVLNATDSNVDEREWDVAHATEMLMSDIHGAITREPALQEYVQSWRRRGKVINSTKQLLECYYASITVVRIPYKGSYMLMNDQIGKLAGLIKDRCSASHSRKKQVRMLANAEKLQFYLQAAYDHFTRDLDTPFDFVKETLRHSPVSRNFEGNILNLAVSIRDRASSLILRNDAEQIFRVLGPMIASCVMFDAARQKLPGTTTRLLDDRYAQSCIGALQTFADMYWPCAFVNSAYEGELGHCCNVRSGHNPKGHQNKQGKIIGNGDYESNLNVEAFWPFWEHQLKASLSQLQNSSLRLSHEFPDRSELQIAALLHQERLNELYSNVLGSATDFVSYSACLCCLRELPECALPCGHVLCNLCVEVYGTRTSRTTIEITRCPLHVRDILAIPPWIVVVKPPHAGARTLCLDGGGVRGIIQLQALQQIEMILGPDLPIQLFFDLIVGTDMGGIIAIGLGVKKWSVASTLDKFKDLCREAFIPREMTSVPLFGALSSMYHGSLYKTQPFAKALRRYFSDQPFFGGATHRSRLTTSVKVAVTATTSLDRRPVVFANYNRPDPSGKKLPYQFTRSDVPSKEVSMCEAARSTSAATPFFKPFMKAETNHEYIGGDSRYMCPIYVAHHETRSIWNDIADVPPDLMLSIGTGRNLGDRFVEEGSVRASSLSINSESMYTSNTMPSSVVKQGRGGAGNYKRHNTMGSISSDSYRSNSSSGYIVRNPQAPMLISFHNPVSGQTSQINDQRQGERIWHRFMSGVDAPRGATSRRRYMRISPEFVSKLPKFDEVQKIDEISREAEEVLRQNSAEMTEAAHRLIASTFFFEKDPGSTKQHRGGYTCTGSIFCRFRPASPELKALGWFLISRLVGEFEPYFLFEARDPGSTPRQIVLSDMVLQDMHLQGSFHLDPIRITAAQESSEIRISMCLGAGGHGPPYPSGVTVLPISGFPRRLMAEDGGVVPHAQLNHSSAVEKPSTSSGGSGSGSGPGSVAGDSSIGTTITTTNTNTNTNTTNTTIGTAMTTTAAMASTSRVAHSPPILSPAMSYDSFSKLSINSLGRGGGGGGGDGDSDYYRRAELEGSIRPAAELPSH
ncbi:hypothetical protein F4778DRAFT_178322 [Xylariomycetidae sp. FL2044]|nr:hypothetical protein F4778DRAFT_178322 [Xylariomycetidae sp. FL2044]